MKIEVQPDRAELRFQRADRMAGFKCFTPDWVFTICMIAAIVLGVDLLHSYLNPVFAFWCCAVIFSERFTYGLLPRIARRAENPVRHETNKTS